MINPVSYELIYLLTNIFGTYIIYKFMGIFFERDQVKKNQEFLSYLAYFVLISLVHLLINIPMLTFLCNLVGGYAVSLNYPSTIKKRLSALALIYLMLMLTESVVAVAWGYTFKSLFNNNALSSVDIELVINKLLPYIIVKGLERYKHIKNEADMPFGYWQAIILVPVVTMGMILMLLNTNALAPYQMIICMVVGLLINIMIFYLYNAINRFYQDQLENVSTQQQNEAYYSQLEILQQADEIDRGIRHDMKNHLLALETYLERGDSEGAKDYLVEVLKATKHPQEAVRSGNIPIDSLINFKNQQALTKGITLVVDLSIPQTLAITPFDLVTILGNLLDNALEATGQCQDGKTIDLAISHEQGITTIIISNPYQGIIQSHQGKISTTKKDAKNHGIGLANVERAVAKYQGIMTTSTENQLFKVNITMYN